MAVYRLRTIWPDYRGRVRLVFRALSLELANRRPTPKGTVDLEIPLMARQQPDLPIGPWSAPDWCYVPTLLPAFEAEKAAAEQGDDAVWEFSWRLRHAFFAESRTICIRPVFEELAGETGLDVPAFLDAWDSGRHRPQVLAESNRGWNELQVPGSPTFVLPSGELVANPGADRVTWTPDHQIERIDPADCPNGDCLQVLRDLLDRAIAG